MANDAIYDVLLQYVRYIPHENNLEEVDMSIELTHFISWAIVIIVFIALWCLIKNPIAAAIATFLTLFFTFAIYHHFSSDNKQSRPSYLPASQSGSGLCDQPSDRAIDGSKCGERASGSSSTLTLQDQASLLTAPFNTEQAQQNNQQARAAQMLVDQYNQAKISNEIAQKNINKTWESLPKTIQNSSWANQRAWIQEKQAKCGIVNPTRGVSHSSESVIMAEIQLLNCDTLENNNRNEVIEKTAQVASSPTTLSKNCTQFVKDDFYYRLTSTACGFYKRRGDKHFANQYIAQSCPSLSANEAQLICDKIEKNIDMKISKLGKSTFCNEEYPYWNTLNSQP